MTKASASSWYRRRWFRWTAGGILVVLLALVVVSYFVARHAEPFLRDRIVAALENHFHAHVELDSFHISFVKGIRAEGDGLRIWPPGNDDTMPAGSGPPLIRLDKFRFRAPLAFQLKKPIHISMVQLQGLEVDLPPRSHFLHAASSANNPGNGVSTLVSFTIGKVECTSAHLVLETSVPGKLPMEIAIARFQLTGGGGDFIDPASPMNFSADLTNPRPFGFVHTEGTLGPWQVSDPGESPLQGSYTFDHADLASFNGIAGILSSTGKYQGTLRNLTVDGDTDTPDFRLTHFGNALPLHTHFHALVDGTNGDTQLDPVDATLGHSHFTCKGKVVRVLDPTSPPDRPASKGHDIAIDVNVDNGRIEDFLRLASRSPAQLLTGAVTVRTLLHIPPGTEPVHRRLSLKGSFQLDQARFTSTKIQDKITELSLRGQGLPHAIKSTDPATTRSTMQADFRMDRGVITLPSLTYTVPGAEIDLKGAYVMEGGLIDFQGAAKLDATVSKMVGGVLGVLLKPADRYFKKDGAGTEVPIHVSGTREDPEFGVDFGRKRNKPQTAPLTAPQTDNP